MATSKTKAETLEIKRKAGKGRSNAADNKPAPVESAPAKRERPNPSKAVEVVSQKEFRNRSIRALHLGDDHLHDLVKRTQRKDGTRFASVTRTATTITSDGIVENSKTVSVMSENKIPAQSLEDGWKRQKTWKGLIGEVYVRLSWRKTDGKDKDGKPIMLAKPISYLSVGTEERVEVKSLTACRKLIAAAAATK